MADTIAESARKASAGSWRKPRMKIYDYNQVSQFAKAYTAGKYLIDPQILLYGIVNSKINL